MTSHFGTLYGRLDAEEEIIYGVAIKTGPLWQ